MYGEHNRVLQTMQVVNKKSRGYCKQENGFDGIIQNSRRYTNLSAETRKFEEDVDILCLSGEIEEGK